MNEILLFLKYLAQSNTINFIIMLIILAYISKKMNLMSLLESSVKNVEIEIKKSDEEKEQAEKILKDSEKTMKKLPDEIEILEKEALSKAAVFKNEIEESAQKNIYSIEQSVHRTILIEEEKFSNLLKDKTVKASVEKAKENIIKQLQTSPELHKNFIKESLEEFEMVKL